MKLTIGNKVRSKYRNVYVIEFTFMEGDADEYSTQDLEYTDDEKASRIFEKIVNYIKNRGYDWMKLRTPENFVDILEMDVDEIMEFWPMDSHSNDYYSSLDGVLLYWYDETGDKYYVKVE